MLQESSVTPQVWLLISNGITGILTFLATIIGLRFKQKREHADVDKTRAEARSLHVSSDISLSRELQAVVDKAESRREQWLAREEQLRGQVVFWRQSAEEIDGKLADAQEMIWKMEKEVSTYETQIERMHHTLKEHNLNYDDTRDVYVGPMPKKDNDPAL
jgi:peptidoglycan hydrolase CwlO-like protein